MRLRCLSLQPMLLLTLTLGLVSAARWLSAHEHHQQSAHDQMRQAAVAFLESLGPDLRDQVTFDFDAPLRTDWHYVPKERKGVDFKDMNIQQRCAAHELLRTALSDKGYLKVNAIMALEAVLRELEADRENVDSIRDPEKYWFALFGRPNAEEPWGWRLEGHHLSLNFTSADGLLIATAPLFMGANPAEVRTGPQAGLRVLGDEIDRARELMDAFSDEQRQQAVIDSQAPADVLTVPGASLDLGTPEGVAGGEMTDEQRALLEQMVQSFLKHLRTELAAEEIRQVEEAGYDEVHFAWAGSLTPGEKHYFRIHGPTFVLEYDDAQGNHAHLVWHSTENDFGHDVLRRHYRESPDHGDGS